MGVEIQTPVEIDLETMEIDLEKMVLIGLYSTPNRENQMFLEKVAKVNNGLSAECRRIFETPDWITWAQIESDVENEIPTAVSNADNTAVLKLLNLYSADLHTQTRMVAKIQDTLTKQLPTNNIERRKEAKKLQIIFYNAPDSDGPQSVPSNIMEVACHILSSVKAADFIQSEGYDSVLDCVINSYYFKRNSIAWRVTFVNVLTNVLCQILTDDVLEKMPSRKWSVSAADNTIDTLRFTMQYVITDEYELYPDSYEKQLLRAFGKLYPKITMALIACLKHRHFFPRTLALMQLYVDLLIHINKQFDTIRDVVPNIHEMLDSVEEAVIQCIEKHFTRFGRYTRDILTSYRHFFEEIYEFRRKTQLDRMYSARRILPVIIKMITWDENAQLDTPQYRSAGDMKGFIEDAFKCLLCIVDKKEDNNEEDNNICTYVLAQCMQHNNLGNIFDMAAKLIFGKNGSIACLVSDYNVKPFIDFMYCICASTRPSNREILAELSTTKALEMLMFVIYKLITSLEELSIKSHDTDTTEETIFKAIHLVVKIIAVVPSMKNTSILHTCTTTRNTDFLAKYRDIILTPSTRSLFDAEVMGYYEGSQDSKHEKYTTLVTTNWQTESQLVVPENFELISHHVTVINLHSLAVLVGKLTQPTLLSISKSLMKVVRHTRTYFVRDIID